MAKPKPTQLSRLKALISDLNRDIGQLERPLNSFDDLIGEVDKALHLPKTVADDIASIRKKLDVVDDVMELGAKVPVIGGACGGVAGVLRPMVRIPKPHGSLGKAEDVLNDIDKTVLKSLKKLVKDIKDPVDRTRKAVNAIHADVIGIETRLDALVTKFGNKVPKGVEECARQIADRIEAPIEALDDANDFVKDELGKMASALQPISDAFKGVGAIFDAIHKAVGKLHNKALDNFLGQLDRFIKKVEGQAEAIVRAAAAWAKFDLDAAKRKLNDLEHKITGMFTAAIDREMTTLKNELNKKIGKIPGVRDLKKQVGKVEDAFETLETEIQKLMGSACAKTLKLLP